MLRIMDVRDNGEVVVHDAPIPQLALPPQNSVRWVDARGASPGDLELIQAAFALHPHTISDCLEYGTQSRLDDYGDYLFVVSHAFAPSLVDPLLIQLQELHCFIGPNFIITIHDNAIAAVDQIWQTSAADGKRLRKGPAWVWHAIVEAMVQTSEPMILELGNELDAIERAVIETGSDISLSNAFRIKRTAVAMRRVLRPLRDTLRELGEYAEEIDNFIPAKVRPSLTRLTERVVRLTEFVEEARETSGSIISGYHAVQATKTNVVMKRLTIFSAVFLPLGFVVGFWGQNFSALPFDSPWAFAGMLSSLVLVPIVLLEWIRKRWM